MSDNLYHIYLNKVHLQNMFSLSLNLLSIKNIILDNDSAADCSCFSATEEL